MNDATREMPQKKRGPRKFWRVTAYASGYMLEGGIGVVLSTYYLPFLMFAMGLGPLLAGLVAGLTKLVDGVIDPVIGILVDRTNTKWGKCRPWLLASVVPIFITYAMLWNNFGIQGQTARFFYFTFAYILFAAATSAGMVPYDALLPRMVGDYSERIDYTAYSMIFSGIASTLSPYIYNAIIPAETAADYAKYPHEFSVLGLVLGAMFAMPMLITFVGSKERPGLPVEERLTYRETLRSYMELLRSSLFRKCYTMTMLCAFIQYAITTTQVLFVLLVYSDLRYQVPLLKGISLTFLAINVKGLFQYLFFVPNIAMMKKKSKHFPYLFDLPILAAGLLVLMLITPNTPVWVFLVGMAFIGAGTSWLGTVSNALMPDLPEVDEMIYGKRREGVIAGMVKMGKQIMQGAAFLVFSLLMTIFGLDESNASPGQATFGTMAAVRIMLCVIPILAIVVILLMARKYKLNAETHARIKEYIAQKHAEGFVEVPAEEQALFAEMAGRPYDSLWIASSDQRQNAS